MNKYKTRPIGEVFKFVKVKLQVVEKETCIGCFFEDKKCTINYPPITDECGYSTRDDRKNVIFKQIFE